MKLLKRLLLAIIIACSIFYIAPMVMSVNTNMYAVQAAKIKINKTKYTMNKGEKYTLKISGTKKKVSWSTSNKKIATINLKGKVTAKKKGKVVITARVSGKKYKCKITVEAPTISKKKYTLNINNTYTLKIKGTSQKIKWETSDYEFVTVNSKGKITAQEIGKATITAIIGKSKYECIVTVKDPNIHDNFNGKTYNIRIDETEALDLYMYNTSKKAVWSISNKEIASIKLSNDTLNCEVKALKAGIVTITAKIDNKVLSCKIIIYNFREDLELTTKASHYSDETTPVVVAYLKNKSSNPYEAYVSIKYYDSNKNEILKSGAYIRVAANSTFAYPFGFQHNTYNDYDSYKIEMEDARAYEGNIENRISCDFYKDISNSWSIHFTNNSGKTLDDCPEYTVIGYNQNGGINLYYQDKGWKAESFNLTTDKSFEDSDGWKNGQEIGCGRAYFIYRYYDNYEDDKVLIPVKCEMYAQVYN